jgi:hypothetical protein
MKSGTTTKAIEATKAWFSQERPHSIKQASRQGKEHRWVAMCQKEVPASITLLPGTEIICAFLLFGGGRSPR